MKRASVNKECNYCPKTIYSGGFFQPMRRGKVMCYPCASERRERRERKANELEKEVEFGRRKDDEMIDGNKLALAFIALVFLVFVGIVVFV